MGVPLEFLALGPNFSYPARLKETPMPSEFSAMRRPPAFATRLLLALALVLTGLAPMALQQRSLAQEEARLTFAFWGDPAEERAYQEVIDAFGAVHPEISVEAQYTANQSDYQTRIATSFAGGNEPDIFLINYRRFGQYAARGALEPIGPYLASSEVLSEEQFYEVPMDAFRYRGGELYCMPQNVSSLVVYINVDLFNQFDVPIPYEGWTLDEFVDVAVALTHDFDGDGVKDVHGLAVDPSLIRYAPFIWGNGGEIVDNVDNPTTLTLDTPEAIEAINWFIDLGQTGYAVAPTEVEVMAEDDQSRFMNGRAAMFMQSRRAVPTLREIDGFTWDVVSLPVGKEEVNILHSDAFCMAASAENKDAAWTFIEFAAGAEGQRILAETGRTVPSMIEIAESDLFLKGTEVGAQIGASALSLAPQNSQVFLDNIATMRRVPSISTWPEVEDAFNTPFKRAFYVEIDVPGAIEVATFFSRDAFTRALEEEERRASE
jgi:multiple sugar transport system substrate-binding protein